MSKRNDTGQAEKPSTPRLLGQVILFGILILFIVWNSISLPQRYAGYVETDFYIFWAGGKAIAEGKNPYEPSDWRSIRAKLEGVWLANQASLYPLYTNLMFVPLSFLPISTAASVWIALSQIMILVSVILCIRTASLTRWKAYIVLIVLGVILFRPTIVTVRNGQLGGLLLLILSLGIWLWKKAGWYWGGVVIGLLVLKPSLAAPFFLLFGLWFLIRKNWTPILGMLTSFALLMGGFYVINSRWFIQWLNVGSGQNALMGKIMPTLWGFSALVMNSSEYWYVLAGISALVIVFLFFWFTRKSATPEEIFILAASLIPLVILFVPYLWSYDHIILVVPVIFILAVLDRLKVPFIFVGLLIFVIDLWALVLLLIAFQVGHDIWSVLLPVSIFLMSLLTLRYTRRDLNFSWNALNTV